MIKKFARLAWAVITLPYGILKVASIVENAFKEAPKGWVVVKIKKGG